MNIVFSGGTYAGKTSLIEYFNNQGYKTIPESGTFIIKELNAKFSLEEQFLFRKKEPHKFYQLIINKQIELENNIKDDGQIVLYDRGIYDYIAMYNIFNKGGIKLNYKRREKKYDLALIFPSFDDFNKRSDSGRLLNRKESNQLAKECYYIYNKHCDAILVNADTLKKRINYIEQRIL